MILSKDEINQVLNSPELTELIDQRAKEQVIKAGANEVLITKQIAERYQISRYSVARLSDQELERLGWKRIKIGSNVRFQRISLSETTYKNAKIQSR